MLKGKWYNWGDLKCQNYWYILLGDLVFVVVAMRKDGGCFLFVYHSNCVLPMYVQQRRRFLY